MAQLRYRYGELARLRDLADADGANYLDLLNDLFLVRRLMPWHSNVGKRLVKSPKIYLRDSGVLHGRERFPISAGVEAIGIYALAAEIAGFDRA
jgi:predicted AAA+ superfamily ATPase